MPEDYMHKYLQPLVGMRVTNIVKGNGPGHLDLDWEKNGRDNI